MPASASYKLQYAYFNRHDVNTWLTNWEDYNMVQKRAVMEMSNQIWKIMHDNARNDKN